MSELDGRGQQIQARTTMEADGAPLEEKKRGELRKITSFPASLFAYGAS
jgi:hypothetical protein